MALSADKIIELYKKGLADGSIATMEPLLSLFMLENNPMSLVGREPMLPLFKTERPKRTTLQAGRQVSKSMNLGALSVLGSGFGGMQIAIFEPRFVQKRAINTQVIAPLLRNCVVSDKLIRPSNIDPMDVKKFLSGGNIFIVNAFKSGDGGRGIGGCGMVMLDESISRNECVCVYDGRTNKHISRKISQIKAGDILTSFNDGCILYSVATRDASFHGHKQCYKITLSSGKTIICTSSHLLPTNIGKRRLEEIIEYVYQRTIIKSGERGGIFSDSAECDNGISAGGRLFAGIGENDKGATLESKPETARVQFTQVPAITRARYKGTANRTESRLRRLLVCIDAEEFKNVSLVVRTDAPECDQDENGNSGILEYDRSPHRPGLVVSRRRVKNCGKKLRRYRNQWVFAERGKSIVRLAENLVGCGRCSHSGESLQHGEGSLYNQTKPGGLPGVCGSCCGVCPTMYAIQNRQSNEQLPALRERDRNNSRGILLRGMSRVTTQGNDKAIQCPYHRSTSRSFQRVEEGESGKGCRESQKVSRGTPRGDTGERPRVFETLSSRASRGVQSEEAGMASGPQGRSCIQSQESSGRSSISRETETGSGKIGCVQGEEIRVPEGARQNSGSACPANGVAESAETAGSRESGRACEDSGKGPADQGEKGSNLERRAPLGGAGEGSRSGSSLPAEKSSRSGEGCEGSRVCKGVCSQEIGVADTRGAGSPECEGPRTAGEKGASRGACTEKSRTLQTEEKTGSRAGNSARTLLTSQPATYAYDPIVSIEYVGYDDVYDIEVVGTHNYILANGICSYNCQDMLPSNIPVLEAVADAKVDTGFRIYSGTAKTIDGTLAMKFEQSSQGHWCVKCECGKYNIFAPEEQLFNTIKDKGCCCAFCDRILNCATGGYIHKFPSRVFTHPGYHLPQIIFPFHHTPNAWKEIIYKKNNIPKTQFYNEVLGVSDSDSVRLLTKADLLAARNNVRSKEQGVSLRRQYDLVVLGIDWGGGGGGESATGLAVIAKSFNNNHFETLYMRRLPTGLSPEQEASIVESVASDFRVDLIAHDYTGAGFMREAFFVQAYPEWRNALFPVSYSFKPNADLVTSSASGSRASYTIDKSKSLLLTMGCIKHGVLTVPWFDPLDAAAPQLDFLAIVEHKNKLEDTEGNVVQRRSEVYLLDKVAGVRDDAAQAANIGFIAACHTLGQYPVITYDSKFDITEEQRKLLLGE